jgi:hypothetical protein
MALSLLAVLRRRLRRPRDAVANLLELLDQCDRLGNRPQLWHAVREAGMCLELLGVDEQAVTLLAAVDSADLVMPLLPDDRAHLPSLREDLERRLGADAFRRAREAGQLLGREGALSLARQSLADAVPDDR